MIGKGCQTRQRETFSGEIQHGDDGIDDKGEEAGTETDLVSDRGTLECEVFPLILFSRPQHPLLSCLLSFWPSISSHNTHIETEKETEKELTRLCLQSSLSPFLCLSALLDQCMSSLHLPNDLSLSFSVSETEKDGEKFVSLSSVPSSSSLSLSPTRVSFVSPSNLSLNSVSSSSLFRVSLSPSLLLSPLLHHNLSLSGFLPSSSSLSSLPPKYRYIVNTTSGVYRAVPQVVFSLSTITDRDMDYNKQRNRERRRQRLDTDAALHLYHSLIRRPPRSLSLSYSLNSSSSSRSRSPSLLYLAALPRRYRHQDTHKQRQRDWPPVLPEDDTPQCSEAVVLQVAPRLSQSVSMVQEILEVRVYLRGGFGGCLCVPSCSFLFVFFFSLC